MSSFTRNQPQYDFITGAPLDIVPAARDALRASMIVRPDVNNEELRAQMHKLQYEVESLRQERDATALRHQEELRNAQNKADSDFTSIQASESGRLTAVAKNEKLARGLADSQEQHAKEKRELERKIRLLQDEKLLINEELEETKTEVASQGRHFKYALNEVESKQKVSQQAIDDLRRELDEKTAALQNLQQVAVERQTAIEALENEIIRLKTQAGDTETLEIIKETLREQVAHITKLEATTQKQQTELRQYRKQQKAIEIVEEEKRTLEVKVRMMHDLRKQLSEAQLQRQILQDERSSWSTYLENLSASDEEQKFDSPESLAKAYIQEREEKVSLVDRLGKIQPELSAKDVIISSLEERISKQQEETEQMRLNIGTKVTDSKAQARLERQRTLAVKEVEYLRAQLKLYEAEEGESHPEKVDEQKAKRVQELEEVIDQYRQETNALHHDLDAAKKALETSQQTGQSSPSKSLKRPLEDSAEPNVRIGELSRKNRALQDDLSKATTALSVLEKDLAAQKSQLASLKASSRTRVLELRSNPTATYQSIKRSTFDALRAENTALLVQLEDLQNNASETASEAFTKPKLVPQATLDRLRLDMNAQTAQLAEKDIVTARLKKKFKDITQEFIDAVQSVLGWNFIIMPNGRVKCTSLFYPGGGGGAEGTGDAEAEATNYIIFDGEKGTMKVSGGPQSAFANEIRGLVDFWVDGRKEMPCFMAACTLEFWERSTRALKV